MANPYVRTVDTVDEDGRPESWTVKFGRLKARDFMLLGRISDDRTPDVEKVSLVHDMFTQMVKSIDRNGKPFDVDEVPMEVEMEVYGLHPSFRGDRPSGNGAENRADAR